MSKLKVKLWQALLNALERSNRVKAKKLVEVLSLLIFALTTPYISAQTPMKEGPPTLTLEAQAKSLVANDEMQVVFAIERDGSDLNAMNQTVLQGLAAAIADAKKVDGIRARMGTVQTNPNWTAQGKPNGWKVRGEVSLSLQNSAQNFASLGNLAGQLAQKLQLSAVNFKLSDEARTAAEKQLIKNAAAAFRSKAQDAASALGYKSFDIKEVNLNNGNNIIIRQAPMMKAMRSDSMSSAPVPSEGGDSEVTVTFAGTVNLK
jgi:predicted secreted protein